METNCIITDNNIDRNGKEIAAQTEIKSILYVYNFLFNSCEKCYFEMFLL